MLSKYWHRLVYRSEGNKVPFLIYPFLFMTAVPGIAYTFFGGSQTVQASILYGLTAVQLGTVGVSVWGIACMAAVVIALVNILMRKKWAGRTAPVLGFMVWTYALIVYLTNGFYYQLLVFALPQVVFWVWHYLRVEDYWRNFDAGLERIR
jgi:hypothetical protein